MTDQTIADFATSAAHASDGAGLFLAHVAQGDRAGAPAWTRADARREGVLRLRGAGARRAVEKMITDGSARR